MKSTVIVPLMFVGSTLTLRPMQLTGAQKFGWFGSRNTSSLLPVADRKRRPEPPGTEMFTAVGFCGVGFPVDPLHPFVQSRTSAATSNGSLVAVRDPLVATSV